MSASSLFPSARKNDLVVESLQDEILIYDLARDQASCLNPTASLVWKYADGKTSVSEIAKKMARELNSPIDARVVWYALEQLDKKHLLDNSIQAPLPYRQMTRRDFLVKAGVVGAAVAIPVVIALTLPKAAMANVSCGASCCTNVDTEICPEYIDCNTPCTCSNPNGGTCQ